MSAFDFPTWAYTKLADKPAPEGVKPMPTPSLDEIEAQMKAEAPDVSKRKPGRPRKEQP